MSMIYSAKELGHLRHRLGTIEADLDMLKAPERLFTVGIDVRNENLKRIGSWQVPDRFSAPVTQCLVSLYEKEVLMLTNLISNKSQSDLAEEIATSLQKIDDLIVRWSDYTVEGGITLYADADMDKKEGLMIPYSHAKCFVNLVIQNLKSHKASLEKRLLMLGEDSSYPSF